MTFLRLGWAMLDVQASPTLSANGQLTEGRHVCHAFSQGFHSAAGPSDRVRSDQAVVHAITPGLGVALLRSVMEQSVPTVVSSDRSWAANASYPTT